MKKRLLVLALVPAVLLVAGCTAPLTAKQVDATLAVSAPADTLVGDPVKLAATATLASKRADKVVVRLQSSSDGKTWTTIDTKSAKGPKIVIQTSLTEKAAGTTKYRTTVSATTKAKKTLASSATETVTTSDIKEIIRTFFYNTTHAFDKGSAAGIAFEVAEDAPIYEKTSATFTQGVSGGVTAGEIDTMVPDLTTVDPDPTWKLTDATSCNPAMTAPPDGRTFVVTVALGQSFSQTYLPNQSTGDFHVTLLDGKLVDYITFCRN